MLVLFTTVGYDDDAGVWITECSSIPGLFAEAETSEEVVTEVLELAPILLYSNYPPTEVKKIEDTEMEIIVHKDYVIYEKNRHRLFGKSQT